MMPTNAKPVLYSSQAIPFRLFEVIIDPKAEKLTFRFDYSGFHWDLPNGTVTLAKFERANCLREIKQGLSSSESLKDPNFIQGLVAKLIHASHIMAQGRRHLRPLLDAFLEAKQPLVAYRRNQIKRDLVWWQDALCCEENAIPIAKARRNLAQCKVYTDASRKGGCAIVIDGKSKTWPWKDGVLGPPVSSWAEATAVELAVRELVLRPNVKGATFQIHCDNEEVIQSWMMGGSKNERLNKIIVSIVDVLVRYKCWITLEKICSKKNPADRPSRSKTSTHGGTLDALLHPDTRENLM